MGGQAALVRETEAFLSMEHPVWHRLQQHLEATHALFRSRTFSIVQRHMAAVANCSMPLLHSVQVCSSSPPPLGQK